MGVEEYFLYDPTAEYLDPSLQGFRLAGDQYEQIKADDTGELHCDQLAITLCLESGKLTFYDSSTGKRLPTEAEAAQSHAAVLQAEVESLSAELNRKSDSA